MKKDTTRRILTCAICAALMFVAFTATAWASIGGPYTPDANTLSLLHLDGNVTDASGNGNNGVLAGTTNWVSSAKFSGGLEAPGPGFGGVDIAVGGLQNFTAEGWFKPTANSQWLLGGANNAFDQMFYTRINADGMFAWGVLGSYGWYENYAGMNAVPLNQWTHIAFTTEYQVGGWYSKLYVNGALQDSIGTATWVNNIIVGRIPWAPSYNAGYIIGQIDEVRISNIVRTDFNAVPEPGSLCTLAAAMVAMGGLVIRRRK